jgi:hypothetical protein
MLAMEARRLLIATLAGGLLAGTLDIVYAFAWLGYYGRSPLWVLQSVASGWLGKAAFTGGAAAGVIGLASHYGISIVAAGLYSLVARGSTRVREHWIVCGTLFGVLVYLFMNFVVMPLSAVPFKASLDPLVILRGFVSHALLFGIPIAWCAAPRRPWVRV